MSKFTKHSITAACMLLSGSIFAQTTLYSENFNGGSHTFTLNSTDVSSSAGTYNFWTVNNAYGGGSGTINCPPFGSFGFTVNPTSQQPASITGNPTSNYLHILSLAAQSSGTTSASFAAADGICTQAENHFAKMSSGVSTVGYDSVEVSFWWLCVAGGTTYGEVYYSTTGGSSWIQISNPAQYFNQNTWIQQKISLAVFENNADFRIAFRFVNQTGSAPSDPPMCVDDVQIKGFNSASIAAAVPSATTFCPNDAIDVDYSASGVFAAGNVFTAQLSDASGSFASPTVLGTLSSTATTGTISGTIPMATAAGTGYRVRVVSSNPGATGAINTTDISIGSAPDAGVVSLNSGADTICPGTPIVLQTTGSQGTLTWEASTNGTNFSTAGSGASLSVAPTQSTWYRVEADNACGNDVSTDYYIHVIPAPTASFNYSQNGNSLDITFTNNTTGTYTSSSWAFGDGFSGTQTNPTYEYDSAGTYIVTLTVENADGCTSTFTDTITVLPITSVSVLSGNTNMALFPNPNNGVFTIEWESDLQGDVVMQLVDMQGRKIESLMNAYVASGKQLFRFDLGEALPTGVYVLHIQSPAGVYRTMVVRQ